MNYKIIPGLLITFLLFIGIVHADSNGVWLDAKDIRVGEFGSDENENPQQQFSFNTLGINNQLQVKGNENSLQMIGKNHSYIEFYPDGKSSGRQAWLGFGTAQNNDLTIQANSNVLINPFGGFVGVGTQNPEKQLDVKGSIMIDSGKTDGGRLIFRGGRKGDQENPARPHKEYRMRVNDGNLGIFPIESSNPNYKGDALTLTQDANVGVGNKNPQSQLDVAGGVRANKGDSIKKDNSNVGYSFEDDGDTGMFAVGGDSVQGSRLHLKLDGNDKLVIGRDSVRVKGHNLRVEGDIITNGEKINLDDIVTSKREKTTDVTSSEVTYEVVEINGREYAIPLYETLERRTGDASISWADFGGDTEGCNMRYEDNYGAGFSCSQGRVDLGQESSYPECHNYINNWVKRCIEGKTGKQLQDFNINWYKNKKANVNYLVN